MAQLEVCKKTVLRKGELDCGDVACFVRETHNTLGARFCVTALASLNIIIVAVISLDDSTYLSVITPRTFLSNRGSSNDFQVPIGAYHQRSTRNCYDIIRGLTSNKFLCSGDVSIDIFSKILNSNSSSHIFRYIPNDLRMYALTCPDLKPYTLHHETLAL